MAFVDSPYTHSREEYLGMLDLISDVYHNNQKPEDFTISRFELWIIYNSVKDKESKYYSKNAQVWKDSNHKIVGAFISEVGEDDIHIIVHPDYPDLYGMILQWIFNNWAVNKDRLTTEIYDDNTHVKELFSQNGFYATGAYGLTRMYDLNDIGLTIELEEGYSIKSAEEQLDIPSRVELIRNAYNSKKLTKEIYEGFQSTYTYSADFDLSVFSPEGRHVSTCMGWIDVNNNIAEIETVGTHTDYRRKGLARAVITECLSRLKKRGIEWAFISSFNETTHKFYDSYKFKRKFKKSVYVWIKK